MDTQKSELHKAIMRRVYAMYAVRVLKTPGAFTVLGLALSVFLLKSFVFVRAVFDNMPNVAEPSAFLSFWGAAVTNAEISVQIVLLSIVVFTAIAVREIVKLVKLREAYASGVLQ